jgi:histidyl-tRNA synthetase
MKASIPKGTRDFSADEMMRRNYVFGLIKDVFRKFGFVEIETPAMENLSSLEGKYGEEGDKLLFRILNSGPVLEEIREKRGDVRQSEITEKGLRYDLTVPFARYVVMHQNEITFPFRRFQIQPVWRADRPQKGRYREFYQCDADVIGSNSLLNEVELIRLIDEVFQRLHIGICIKLNNRKILAGIAEVIGSPERLIDITVALDKLDKVGRDKVNEELLGKGIDKTALDKIQPLLSLQGSNEEKFGALRAFLDASEVGKKGIEELELIFSVLKKTDAAFRKPELDISLARGLNYYTGAIIEVKTEDKRSAFTSSICGGGRYDDLTGIFGLPNVSGVGISFGADRICDVLSEVNGYPDFSSVSTRILFVNFGMEEAMHCLRLVNQLRDDGIGAELYPDSAKMKKQMSYADSKKIPYVALIGSDEMKSNEIKIKNMASGEQSVVLIAELLRILK